MATWHAEIVNAAGGMAGFLYGATEKKARAHYGRTLELMPDAKVVCVEYAFGLLLMDEERNRRRRAVCSNAPSRNPPGTPSTGSITNRRWRGWPLSRAARSLSEWGDQPVALRGPPQRKLLAARNRSHAASGHPKASFTPAT